MNDRFPPVRYKHTVTQNRVKHQSHIGDLQKCFFDGYSDPQFDLIYSWKTKCVISKTKFSRVTIHFRLNFPNIFLWLAFKNQVANISRVMNEWAVYRMQKMSILRRIKRIGMQRSKIAKCKIHTKIMISYNQLVLHSGSLSKST